MGFPRQESWSGLLFPPLGDLPDPGIKPTSPVAPTLAGGIFTTETVGKTYPSLTQITFTCFEPHASETFPWYLKPRYYVFVQQGVVTRQRAKISAPPLLGQGPQQAGIWVGLVKGQSWSESLGALPMPVCGLWLH